MEVEIDGLASSLPIYYSQCTTTTTTVLLQQYNYQLHTLNCNALQGKVTGVKTYLSTVEPLHSISCQLSSLLAGSTLNPRCVDETHENYNKILIIPSSQMKSLHSPENNTASASSHCTKMVCIQKLHCVIVACLSAGSWLALFQTLCCGFVVYLIAPSCGLTSVGYVEPICGE